ncbi:hypothetical protein Glove_153g67 [Diversispora epigaea]|nr:hypothetical protein Glove_153g67 [Diversispora epigaea]
MLSELVDMAASEELDPETIPKVETIENWIGRYSAACKREMAAIVLEPPKDIVFRGLQIEIAI